MIFCLPQLRRPAWVFGNCCAGTVTGAESTNTHPHPLRELAASLLLWALALMVGLLLVGRMPASWAFWRTLAQAKTRPLTKATRMAVTLPKVMGAEEDLAADGDGSLLSAPTIE